MMMHNCKRILNLYCTSSHINATSCLVRGLSSEFNKSPPGSREFEYLRSNVPLAERPGYYNSILSMIVRKNKKMKLFPIDFMTFCQQRFDLSYRGFKNREERKQFEMTRIEQTYLKDREIAVGFDLAAAHFIVYRDGAVKFYGKNEWIKKDENGKYILPDRYNEDYKVEAIDASKTHLMFEGLENMANLKQIKWLSVRECPYIDDWCLKRISNAYYATLEYLDVSGCPNVTEKGIETLHRLRNLKTLRVENLPSAKNLELVCLLLEDMNPTIKVEGVTYVLEDTNYQSKQLSSTNT